MRKQAGQQGMRKDIGSKRQKGGDRWRGEFGNDA